MPRTKGSKNKVKTKSDVPGASGNVVVIKARAPKPAAEPRPNQTDDERRMLFLSNVNRRKKLTEDKDAAVSALRNHAKSIKADGFTVDQVDVAIRLQTPEGEDSIREKMANQIQAAQWIGSPLGTQFSFDLVDRTPAVDRAFDEGKRQGLAGDPMNCPYDSSVPQYKEFVEGFHDGNAALLAKGIKPLEDDDNADLRPRHLRQPGASVESDAIPDDEDGYRTEH